MQNIIVQKVNIMKLCQNTLKGLISGMNHFSDYIIIILLTQVMNCNTF